MKAWSLQEAKARFSQLVDLCHEQGPQLVIVRRSRARVLRPDPGREATTMNHPIVLRHERLEAHTARFVRDAPRASARRSRSA